jgi:hypothetical protein
MRRCRHTVCFLLAVALVGVPLILESCAASGVGRSGTSTSNWAQYHDQLYPFQLPIPPGWQVHVQTNANCDHSVDFLPSGAAVPIGPIGAERLFVRVVAGCPDWRATLDDPNEMQSGTTTIFGVAAVVYDDHSLPGWTNRTAVAHFGAHQYIFNVQAPANRAQQDVGLFTHVLQGFRYQGT